VPSGPSGFLSGEIDTATRIHRHLGAQAHYYRLNVGFR
jgi:hypothetical protein